MDICILVADHVVVCQKSTQYCNYPPIKKNFFFKYRQHFEYVGYLSHGINIALY